MMFGELLFAAFDGNGGDDSDKCKYSQQDCGCTFQCMKNV